MRICLLLVVALSLFPFSGCGPSKGTTVLPTTTYDPAADPTDPSNMPPATP